MKELKKSACGVYVGEKNLLFLPLHDGHSFFFFSPPPPLKFSSFPLGFSGKLKSDSKQRRTTGGRKEVVEGKGRKRKGGIVREKPKKKKTRTDFVQRAG